MACSSFTRITVLLFGFCGFSCASVIGFEGDAGTWPYGAYGPVYTESGFSFTATAQRDIGAAIYPMAYDEGDDTSVLAFAPNTTITMVGTGPFNLTSLLAGVNNYGAFFGPTNITVKGFFANGSTVSETFYGLTSSTLEMVGFNGIQAAAFTASNDSFIDDVTANSAAPEPSTLLLFGVAIAGLAIVGNLRRRAAASDSGGSLL